MGVAISRWASSRTASRCSIPRRSASIGSGEVVSAPAARCGANATSLSTESARALLRAERSHELVEVLLRRGDGLLTADHLEEVLAIAAVDDGAEEHLILL